MEEKSNQPDLISGLADSILIRILSFLPSNLSGRTSILSRRWRNLWAYVPELSFQHGCKDAQLFSFLSHRKSSKLRRFQVSVQCHGQVANRTVDQAICFCSSAGVEELDLSFPVDKSGSYYLRARTLSCWGASLRVMNLCGCIVSCPGKINLCKLEELQFCDVQMEHGAFDQILTGCPSLQSFEMSWCQGVSLIGFHHSNLKRLVVECCNNLEHIQVSVPNLNFFKYGESAKPLKTFLMRVENLEESQLCLLENWVYNCDGLFQDFRHLFRAVAQAKHLKIYCRAIQNTLAWMHTFDMDLTCTNVKSLTLEGVELKFLPVVPLILRLLPSIENLELSHVHSLYSPGRYSYTTSAVDEEKELCMYLKDQMQNHIDCLSCSLRRIYVRYFQAQNTQIELLKLLLQNASVLEIICFNGTWGSIARLLKARQVLTSCTANKATKFLDQNTRHFNILLDMLKENYVL